MSLIVDFTQVTPRQVKAARVLLDWDQSRLGLAAGLSHCAIQKFERGERAYAEPIYRALWAVGVRFSRTGVWLID